MDEDVTNSLTGNFITYRGSMINWSPAGRNGSGEDRESFVDFDKKTGYRKKVLSDLHEFLRDNSISVKASLGGDTSFDLFPLGWDKTFCLKYFDSNSNFYFFGDRCYPGGNDFEIYEKIKKIGSAYSVSGPQQTYQILTQLIKDFENESMDR